MLGRAGCPKDIQESIPDILQECQRCRQQALPLHRPTVKSTMARFFNHMMQTDGFISLGINWVIMIDECFRYKQVEELATQEFKSLLDAFLSGWFRYFGPPLLLTVDQGSALSSMDMASLCDRYNITRLTGGSDPSTAKRPGKHTKTGLRRSTSTY